MRRTHTHTHTHIPTHIHTYIHTHRRSERQCTHKHCIPWPIKLTFTHVIWVCVLSHTHTHTHTHTHKHDCCVSLSLTAAAIVPGHAAVKVIRECICVCVCVREREMLLIETILHWVLLAEWNLQGHLFCVELTVLSVLGAFWRVSVLSRYRRDSRWWADICTAKRISQQDTCMPMHTHTHPVAGVCQLPPAAETGRCMRWKQGRKGKEQGVLDAALNDWPKTLNLDYD